MTDSKGAARCAKCIRAKSIGTKMQLGERRPAIAKRLTMEICRMLRDETVATVSAFGRALDYPRSGVAQPLPL
jgi:hypothetical protein